MFKAVALAVLGLVDAAVNITYNLFYIKQQLGSRK